MGLASGHQAAERRNRTLRPCSADKDSTHTGPVSLPAQRLTRPPRGRTGNGHCIFCGRSNSFWTAGTWYHFADVGRGANGGGRSRRREADVTHGYLAGRSRRGRSGRGARRGVAWQTERAGRTEPRCHAGRFDRDGREGCLASIAAVVRCAATWSAATWSDTAGRADADVRRGAHRARRAGRHRRARPARRQGRAARRRKGDCPDPCRSKWRVGGDGAGAAAQRGPARTARTATHRGPCAGHLGPGRGGGGAEAARRRRSTRGVDAGHDYPAIGPGIAGAGAVGGGSAEVGRSADIDARL